MNSDFITSGVNKKVYLVSMVLVYVFFILLDYVVVTNYLVDSYWEYDIYKRVVMSSVISLIFFLRLKAIHYTYVFAVLPFAIVINTLQVSKFLGLFDFSSITILDIYEILYYLFAIHLLFKNEPVRGSREPGHSSNSV
jgi:hypothetical protein